MVRKLMIALAALGISLSFAGQMAAAEETHLSQAISHTREAVVAGREGKPNALVLHATEALGHANAAQQEKPNTHVKAGIRRLKEAINFGKAKRSSATKIADRALQEFERAPQ